MDISIVTMPRKIVKVYLTPQQKRLLEVICHGLGMDESAVLRMAFLEYANRLNLITEEIHRHLPKRPSLNT